MINEFQADMLEAGVICKEPIIDDGVLRRFSPGGKGDKDGWYVFYGMAGAFGDWSRGIHEKWSTKHYHEMTSEEKTKLNQQVQQATQAREREVQRAQDEASQKALEIWDTLSEAGESTYLNLKQVNPFGVRFGQRFIAIPLKDINNKLWSLQKISDDGQKRFLPGGRKKGCFHHLGILKDGESIYAVEGYATGASVYIATNQTTVIAFDAGNLEPVIEQLRQAYPKSSITITGDDDASKKVNMGRQKAEQAAVKHGCAVVFPRFKNMGSNTTSYSDFNDLHVTEGLEEVRNQLLLPKKPALRSVNIKELLEEELPPRELILSPLIPEQGLVMLYAPRGIGKTYLSISVAYTVASGGEMLGGRWKSEKACKVLYIDGEMPATALQQRLGSIVKGYGVEPEDYNFLQFITPDLQLENSYIPDLSTLEGQKQIDEHLSGVKLLILDNLSALCRSGKENESESWAPMQGWLLKLRRQGISVLLIHHANKVGGQRGTSKKEDLLDTVVSLQRPKDYDPKEGARFEVHYEKARGFYGDDAKSFEVTLKAEQDTAFWHAKDIEDLQTEKIILLSKEKLNQREIAKEIGVSAATVNRTIKKAKEEGRFHG